MAKPKPSQVAQTPPLIPADYEGLLDLWEDKLKRPQAYRADPIIKWQVEELRKYRPKLFPDEKITAEAQSQTQPASDTDLCDTYGELAARLTLHYKDANGSSCLKYEIDTDAVSKWKKGKRLPEGAPTPPPSVANRKHSLRLWIIWFDRYLMPDWKLDERDSHDGAKNLTELRRANEIAQIEFDEWERQRAQGKYIKVTEAARLGGGMLRQQHDYWKNRNEKTIIDEARGRLQSASLHILAAVTGGSLRKDDGQLDAGKLAAFVAHLRKTFSYHKPLGYRQVKDWYRRS